MSITSPALAPNRWLLQYYSARALFSFLWVAAMLALAPQFPILASVLLVLYPAWDAAANYADASRNGGLGANRTLAINVLVSALAAIAVLLALGSGPGAVLTVFGAWAIFAGLLQLATAVTRWRSAGAQWAMALSGVQSALAGGFFIVQAQQAVPALAQTLAGYAGFGAVYFIASAVSLLLARRARSAEPA
jgi:hypothetical protein